MAKATKPQRPTPRHAADTGPWFSLADAARAFDVTRQTFDDTYRPLVPEADVRSPGRKGTKIRVRGLIDALVTDRVAKATPAKVDDPLMAGGESPALERYRNARATLAELDVGERQKVLIRAQAVEAALGPGIMVMRSAGDRLAREFGNGAADVYNEALDEFCAAALAACHKFYDEAEAAEGTKGTEGADPGVSEPGLVAPARNTGAAPSRPRRQKAP